MTDEDRDLEQQTGEPHVDGWPLTSMLPAREPDAWIGPVGQTMPHEIYKAWAPQYPDDAAHFQPLYCATKMRAAIAAEREKCQPNGLKFDAFGEPRKRYVRVTLDGTHCVMHPSEGDTYFQDARDCGDDSTYLIADVWLSEREFDDLPEHEGF